MQSCRSPNLYCLVAMVQVPESNITYSMTLVQATGGAKLSYQNLVASVTILANDDPISFAMSSVIALEGTNATFVVVRGGRSSGESLATPPTPNVTAPLDCLQVLPLSTLRLFTRLRPTVMSSCTLLGE